ncbi:KAP family P-loop domain-containing protein [Sporobacter termitidis DSM 10068]|uniref:KAP family P-loop domain-containing protein n=1 Tax=Sporobacter termitidis DSM 10068 TaxID=1123282 RepID=A0A1M5YEM3_9FIRM|nr:P-loop NTPase fold protein [Sporobacter termitidis]SHI10354.1 KAP family P-loop domain-containing protein [Sporobacter termitidis DSM 10068]
MSYLSNDDIIKLVSEYLKESFYSYAIMLDGSWGSGKTYFIKNILIPKLKGDIKQHSIYISLYGIRKTEDISNAVFTAIAEDRIGKGKKLIPLISNSVRVLAEVVGNKIGSDTAGDTDLQKVFSPFIDFTSYFYIFDDLERCSMPINDVMGYINHFVEQNDSKVIIVANQVEIGSLDKQNNLELKYFFASQAGISWPTENNNQAIWGSNTISEKNHVVDLEEIKKRINYVFDENILYMQIKEKLIGKTIYYQPDLSIIVPMLFSKCLEIETRELDLWSSLVCDIFTEEKHFNIRTLQFSLLFFAKVTAAITPMEKNNEILKDILFAIVRVAIGHKKGNPPYVWSDNSEYGVISLKNDILSIHGYFQSFKFIHDYIYYSDYNAEHIVTVISSYSRSKESYADPTNKLKLFWQMEDDAIENEISIMFKNLEERKYKGESYRWVISLIFMLKGIDIEPIPVTKFIDMIKSNILEGESLSTMQQPAINQNSPCFLDYKECMENLVVFENEVEKTKTSDNINTIFEMASGWGEGFYDYYNRNESKILKAKEFFKHVDVERCVQRIIDSPVKELSDFLRGIGSIYNFSNLKDYFEADGENFNKLKHTLQSSKIKGKTKQYNISILNSHIDEILKRLMYNPI